MAVVGETEVEGTHRILHEKEGKDWKASGRFVRRGGSHLSVLPPILSSPNPPENGTSTFFHPPSSSVWASKTPSFSFPSSSLFPMPRYQGKG